MSKSDNEKILADFVRKRARHYLNDILMPLLRKAVKQSESQDVSSNASTSFAVTSVYGAAVEDKEKKYTIN